jgi:hypothetical protein
MSSTRAETHHLRVGDRLAVSFQRTLRVPDDGRRYPLPPGFGALPVHRVEDYPERIPPEWRRRGSVFVPLYQREALWLGLSVRGREPVAVQIGVGRVNAVSGGRMNERLHEAPQDYLVCPPQLWLDGINAGDQWVRQFVAMPLGADVTVEAQVTGAESFGGVQIAAFEPRPRSVPRQSSGVEDVALAFAPDGAMGLGAGGRISQRIYPDPYGVDVWLPGSRAEALVHLVNSRQYREITGREPPPSPITAQRYAELGLPWFELYDEHLGDVAPPSSLTRVESIAELEARRGDAAREENRPIQVDPSRIRRFRIDGEERSS